MHHLHELTLHGYYEHYATTAKLEDYGQESPPHMVNLLEDVSVRDGESATFKCLISGNPKPSITWFHNSKIVKPSPDFLQFYDPDCVCSLSIREVFPEDGGRYTMIAKNLFGIASSSAELLVVENEYIRGYSQRCMHPHVLEC